MLDQQHVRALNGAREAVRVDYSLRGSLDVALASATARAAVSARACASTNTGTAMSIPHAIFCGDRTQQHRQAPTTVGGTPAS